VYKLSIKNEIIGFYSFLRVNSSEIKLDNLFVKPVYIGNGVGKRLIIDFFKRIQHIPFQRVTLEADPHAKAFYSKLGFQIIGRLPTSIENRFLPIMAITKESTQRILEV